MFDSIKTLPTLDGIPVLNSDSGPVLYNERGGLMFDEQTTVQEAGGTMRTGTTLDRPLGATPTWFDNITLPQGLCNAAFLDSKGNCVAVQLASSLNMPLDRAEHQTESIWKGMPETDHKQYEIDGHHLRPAATWVSLPR